MSRNKMRKKPDATATSGGGIREFGKDLARSAKRLNSNMRTARKYVTEDVKRRVTGEPTQREERGASDAKVKKMNATNEVKKPLRTMNRKIKPMKRSKS